MFPPPSQPFLTHAQAQAGPGPSTYAYALPPASPSHGMLRSVSNDLGYAGGGGDDDDELDMDMDGDGDTDDNIFRDMTFDEILEDLNARFLLNLPKEEMSLVRMYWQAEQAHWFYEDYLRPLNPHLPSLGQRHFTQLIIASSPIYTSLAGPEGIDYDGIWGEYISYKSMVPCCGGILLNEEGTKALMVRGWKSNAGWSFPRGKINLNEPETECAIREVEEETGFDLTGRINPADQIQTQINAQVVTMFIVPGVNEGTIFEAQTRKEIGAIEWVKLTDLPTWTGKKPKKAKDGVKEKKFYNVTPFVGPLKRWLTQHGYNPHPPSSTNKKQSHQPQQQQQLASQIQAPAMGSGHVSQGNHHRDLQPFLFDTATSSLPVPTPATAGIGSLLQTNTKIINTSASASTSANASALDHLFGRFITKQQEDLDLQGDSGGGGAKLTGGEEQKEGLERLFGGLGVGVGVGTGIGTQSLKHGTETEHTTAETQTEEERLEKEDEDLARLLGGVGYTPKPVTPVPTPRVQSDKANRLLSLLTGNKAVAESTSSSTMAMATTITTTESTHLVNPPLPLPTTTTTNANPITTRVVSPPKPHQANLLSLLSPQPKPPIHTSTLPSSSTFTSTNQTQIPTQSPIALATATDTVHTHPTTATANSIPKINTDPQPIKPISLPTSPRPPTADADEMERKEKQRRLLEMTLAGIGLDSSVPTTSSSDLQFGYGLTGSGAGSLEPSNTGQGEYTYTSTMPNQHQQQHPTAPMIAGHAQRYSPAKSSHSNSNSNSSPTTNRQSRQQPQQQVQPGVLLHPGHSTVPIPAPQPSHLHHQPPFLPPAPPIQSHQPRNATITADQSRLLAALNPRPPAPAQTSMQQQQHQQPTYSGLAQQYPTGPIPYSARPSPPGQMQMQGQGFQQPTSTSGSGPGPGSGLGAGQMFLPGRPPLGPARPPMGYQGGVPGQPGQLGQYGHSGRPYGQGQQPQYQQVPPPSQQQQHQQSYQTYQPTHVQSGYPYRPAPPAQNPPYQPQSGFNEYAPYPQQQQQQQQQRQALPPPPPQNQQLHQPVPRPAAMGLLAMINGTGGR